MALASFLLVHNEQFGEYLSVKRNMKARLDPICLHNQQELSVPKFILLLETLQLLHIQSTVKERELLLEAKGIRLLVQFRFIFERNDCQDYLKIVVEIKVEVVAISVCCESF